MQHVSGRRSITMGTMIGFGFVGWVLYYAGTTFAAQAEALRAVVEAQAMRRLRAPESAWLLKPLLSVQ